MEFYETNLQFLIDKKLPAKGILKMSADFTLLTPRNESNGTNT
jgi:hypothetical protein